MGMFDYFVGNLKCSICQQVSESDAKTNMQTKIREHPDLSYLGTGHPLEISPIQAERADYVTNSLMDCSQVVRILDVWECPFCRASHNWAWIIVRDSVIEDIVSVAKSYSTLKQSNFMAWECLVSLAEELELD